MLLHFFVHRRKSCTFVPSKTERFMDRIRLKDKEFELFIPESDIQAAIAKMAVQIKRDGEASERGCRRCKIGNDAFQAGILEMRVDSGLCRLTDTR